MKNEPSIRDEQQIDTGTWETLSGPEYLVVGIPRRRRKVYVVRLAVDHQGIARNGACCFRTEGEARAYFNRRKNPAAAGL